MLSETLQEGLQKYAIGEKLRALRLRKKMGLVELGRHTALSAALISKIERGRLFPTLPTLLRIAMVFNVGLDYFFTYQRRRVMAVTQKKERLIFEEKFRGDEIIYRFECLDFKAEERKLSAFLAEFPKTAPGRKPTHQHDGVEFLYVLGGSLNLTVDGDETLLQRGDAIYFDSTAAHSYAAIGAAPCAALVVTVP
jgi:transcriptional regulator with XRE-family HTH domain